MRGPFAFAGGGPAALVLADRLLAAFPDAELLVVDDTPPASDRRTFAYWTDRPTPFDEAGFAAWPRLRVAGPGGARVVDLGAYRYRAFDVGSWRSTARDRLLASGRVRWIEGRVDALDEDRSGAHLAVDGSTHLARFAFDSRLDSHALDGSFVQTFHGAWVETATPRFDPGVPTLMDFRIATPGAVRFGYALPATDRRAMVMAVTMSPGPAPSALDTWLDVLGLAGSPRLREEAGLLPMRIGPWPRRMGDRVLRIGLAGGRIKPSTGYGLTRFDLDAERVVDSLRAHGHPFELPPDPARAAWLDGVFLRGLAAHPDEAPSWFDGLFARVPAARLLRFLDEAPTAADLAAVAGALPLARFAGLAAGS